MDQLGVLELVLAACFLRVYDWLFHNPFCGLMFRCGCTWNWAGPWGAGGWSNCNVHHRHGPQCPWCSVPWENPSLSLFVNDDFVVALCLLFWAVLKARKSTPPPLRLVLPPLFWLLYNTLCGLAFFLFFSPAYPYFFFIDLSASTRPIDWVANNTIPADLPPAP
jgi:hypothetical protein